MGFLDNLENDLKNLDSVAERDPSELARKHASKEAARLAAQAAAPHAAQLRTSPFTAELLNQAVLLGRSRRLIVRVLWLGSNLRLQAGDNVLELRPGADGVRAHFVKAAAETESFPVDFSSSAESLARRWIESFSS